MGESLPTLIGSVSSLLGRKTKVFIILMLFVLHLLTKSLVVWKSSIPVYPGLSV